MITINNKSRYFSASEDMFPTMERNFAWLFGMQTPEQGWKTVLAITIMYRAQGSAEEERQYGYRKNHLDESEKAGYRFVPLGQPGVSAAGRPRGQ